MPSGHPRHPRNPRLRFWLRQAALCLCAFCFTVSRYPKFLAEEPPETGHVNHLESFFLAGEQMERGVSGGLDQFERFLVGHTALRDRAERQVHQELQAAVTPLLFLDR